mmetsp:Transcript_36589/g.88683  ORF Transcript_36589/g.88683 Transcript_36589/m.88683 type:complete len:2159 (+) Transcript_36589:2-6478(+)
MDIDEIEAALQLYQTKHSSIATAAVDESDVKPAPKKKKSPPKKKAPAPKKKKAAKKKRKLAGAKTTGLSDEEEESIAKIQDLDDDEDEEGTSSKKSNSRKKPPSKRSGNPPRKMRRALVVTDDSSPSPEKPKEEVEEETKESSTSRYGRRRRSSVKSYKESDSEDDDDDEFADSEDDDERPKRKRGSSTSRKPATKSKKKNKNDDDDEEEFEEVSDGEESEDLEADWESEEEGFESEDDYDVIAGTKKAPPRKRGKGKSAKPTPKASQKKKEGKKSMKDSFEPINRPLYPDKSLQQIREEKQFLDPCGQEATDDIISRLVGEQVDRIQPLLQRALKANNHLGSETMPLKLGTACSGTDAPALALTLVQEQLRLRNLEQELHYEHTFSCEVEPFKQAYLARNFDSLLYPDICKLTDKVPRDAYGQPQPIPEYNLFVAGTSCKNFSMLRANKRLDIEDKGCSGETFLAAVEHIFDKLPPFCVLENVVNAPWAKMSEYIEGKIKLSSCDEKKAITGAKKNEKLEFVLKNGKITVHRVPSVFGVRYGSAVAGYSESEDDLNSIHQVEWPKHKSKSKSCTLAELVEYNNISMDNDTLVFEVPVRYRTQKIKVDTKDFGLPQTRNRMYLFVWREQDGDDLGEYWKLIVEHLKSPVRHSLEAFVLQEDHDIIRVFREALRGPAGRSTKRGAFLEADFWTSTSANLPHNKNCRTKLGIEDKARAITNWGPFGRKKIPPHYWLEYLDCQSQRHLDMLDILHASAARDAESHDSSFASFVWNISQNTTREKHRTACPGISGCVTPGGEFFLPHFGRPLLGCEKLLLQGIPYFRLALGTETEVQLGDLAGNAMSLTVVGATLLAAICCKQLREEAQKQHLDASLEDQLEAAKRLLVDEAISRAPNLTESQIERAGSINDAFDFVKELSQVSEKAIDTSIWCTCETSGQNSLCDQFFQCEESKMTWCQECCNSTAGYNLEGHKVKRVMLPRGNRNLGDFASKLRNILPPTIFVPKASLAELPFNGHTNHNPTSLANLNFNLHRVSRIRRGWHVHYFAREGQVGEALAQISIRVGELPDNQRGAMVELCSFLPAKVAPLEYGLMSPIAVWTCHKDHQRAVPIWMAPKEEKSCALRVVGSSPAKSFRSEVGLTQEAADGVSSGCKKKNNTKMFMKAKSLGEERRWNYSKKWEYWPDELNISEVNRGSTGSFLCGRYIRARCRRSFNQGAAWVRQEEPKLYLLIQPNVSRTGPDSAIISRSSSHEDSTSVVARFPEMWQPNDALVEKCQVVEKVTRLDWYQLNSFEWLVPKTKISITSPNKGVKSSELLNIKGMTNSDCDMLALHAGQNGTEVIPLQMTTGQKAQQTVRAFNAICVSKILQFAASNEIGYDLSSDAEWKTITPSDMSQAFGSCSRSFPRPPAESWRYDEERKEWDRFYGDGESKAFYKALEERPRAFEFLLDRANNRLRVNLNPEVVAHYAAGHLSRGRGFSSNDTINVSVRLCASQFQSDPKVDAFRVPSCKDEQPIKVELKKPFKLYERQQKVVSKMLAIENRVTDFAEIEMYEEHMPGSTGWTVIAKAQRNAKIAGGVIADAIGAGKTVISIALILRGLQESRSRPKSHRQSSATLVVVPSHLISQWKNEFKKFTDGLVVHCIYDLNSLQKLTVKQLSSCDCVICPVDILESSGYVAHLLKACNMKADDCPKMPTHAGQKELTGAKGVWIPATSQDPYGGANSSHNQKRRNQSARYTYLYLNAVHAIRKKEYPDSKKGVPLEYFEWERIIVDEIHESLCCTKEEVNASNESRSENEIFREKNRRAGRELLGITTKDLRKRPLIARKSVFGLTGTPLLDSANRVIELASLIGCTYVLGLSSHWRKLERESCRDIFLHYYLEPKQSRIIRSNLFQQCQKYIDTACVRNKVGDEMKGIKLEKHVLTAKMSKDEGELYLKSQSGIQPAKRSFAIKPEDFDVSAGHDITKLLRQNISLESRKQKLVKLCNEILMNDPTTKIIVFADGRVGGGISAREGLNAEGGPGCTWLSEDDSVEVRNQKISWYQHGDATEEDKARPRVLVLHFEHAAGLNLQTECYNLILFCPLYIGNGGASSDPVSDVSTELQAIGRVFRPGQTHPVVNLYRIEVQSPDGEECLDGQLIRRNTNEETVAMAVNSDEGADGE